MRWSIKTALRLTFVLLAALPILLVGHVTLKYLTVSMEKECAERNILLAESFAGELDRFLEGYIHRQEHLAHLLEDRLILQPGRLNDFLALQVADDDYLEMLWVLDEEGRVRHLAPFDENILGLDQYRQGYYTAALEQQLPRWGKVLFSPQTGASSIAVAVPFERGMVIAHLSLKAVRDMISSIDLGDYGYVAVVDQDGTIIAHHNQQMIDERFSFANHAHIAQGLAGQEGTFHYEFNDRKQLGSIASVSKTQWLVAVSQPLDKVFAPITNLRQIIYMGTLIALLVAVLAAWLSLQRILTPLNKLAQNTKRLMGGDYSFPPSIDGYTEIVDLSESFRNMVKRISEREKALLESENRLGRVIEQSPVSIQIHGLDGKLITSNKAYSKLYAFNEDVLAELYEKYNLLQDEQAEQLGLMSCIERVYAGEDVVFPSYEYDGPDTLRTLDFDHPISRRCWIQTRGFPLKDEAGNVTSAVFMSVDFTEQRQAEMAQRSSEEKFRQLMTQAPFAIEIYDLEGKIVQANHAFAKMHNLEGEALNHVLTHYNICEDEQAKKLGLQPYIERVYAGEDVVFPPYKYSTDETTRRLGKETASHELWAQVRGFPLKNSQGKVTHTVFLAEDITEQTEAQEELKEERAYTDDLIQAANVMIVSLDMKGHITNMNPAAETVTGYQEDELIGKNWMEILIPAEYFPETHKALQGALSDKVPEQYENLILTKSGEERIISWSNSEIRRQDTVIGITSIGVDVTERKQAQALLLESESRFRATFEQAAVGIAHVSPDGDFLRINQRFGNILGYTESEMLALTFQEITHPDDLEADLDRVNKLLAGESETYSLEKKYFHKNGGIIWVNLTVSLLRISDGKPDYFISVIEDISERKMAEMALQESEEKFRSFIEQSPTTFELYDKDGYLVQVNRAFENLWNLQADDVVNKFNILESSQVKEVGLLPYIKRAFSGEEIGAIPDVDFNASREDVENKEKSRGRWLSSILYPVRDVQGNVTHVVMMHEDITEQNQAERKVRDSEQAFRGLVEQSPISIQIINRDGGITKVNQAFQKLWGISDEDLEEVLDTYNTFEDAQVEKLGLLPGIRRAFAGENVILPVVEYDCPETMKNLDLAHVMSNKRWIQARLYPVKNTEGELLNVVYLEEDMTEQRVAEIRLNEYQARLRALASELTLTEEQERRRIATELHDGAAQSLALARVKLVSANKAVKDSKAAEKLVDLSQLLKESLQQIRGILLDLSSPSLNEIGLAAALSEWLEEHVGRRQGLQTSFSYDCEEMNVDEDTLAILFRNSREIIMNTIKHAEASRVSVQLHCLDQILHIEITDDGKGFNPDKRQKQPGSNSGFGLFSVYERMASMGGSLTIESSPGNGCKCTLKMPMLHCYKGE